MAEARPDGQGRWGARSRYECSTGDNGAGRRVGNGSSGRTPPNSGSPRAHGGRRAGFVAVGPQPQPVIQVNSTVTGSVHTCRRSTAPSPPQRGSAVRSIGACHNAHQKLMMRLASNGLRVRSRRGSQTPSRPHRRPPATTTARRSRRRQVRCPPSRPPLSAPAPIPPATARAGCLRARSGTGPRHRTRRAPPSTAARSPPATGFPASRSARRTRRPAGRRAPAIRRVMSLLPRRAEPAQVDRLLRVVVKWHRSGRCRQRAWSGSPEPERRSAAIFGPF